MELRYSKQAIKYLSKMPKQQASALRLELKKLAADFDGYAGDLIKMSGCTLYRLRVGGYRAILELREQRLVLMTLKIGPRGDVYK
ncbi:type II toxin-antitoxin system RelE/ParE family toxin [Magnetovirga frankeli]|uniref:type II toxin-antitoxin system RelE family toxin n=1 Tax=Magnetovirga frankeli TaxID=947516 RepID=UPI0012932B51|nr:type II toxin-antitoxin system RelE/ParE family toxin [gamma proteobacterium SS-5]